MPGRFFDTNVLIYIASADPANCDLLWWEDMQHGMVVDGRLRIVSPYHVMT